MQRLPRLTAGLVIICAVLIFPQGQLYSAIPYTSFSFDAWGQPVVGPAPYEPIMLIDGFDILQEDRWSMTGYSVIPLSQPYGLAVDAKTIFILQTRAITG